MTSRLKKLKGIYFKFVMSDLSRNGLTYHLGRNVDPVEFNPTGSCRPGGIYFTDAQHIRGFVNYGTVIAILEPVGQSYEDPQGGKWKAHEVNILRFVKATRKDILALPTDLAIPLYCGLFQVTSNVVANWVKLKDKSRFHAFIEFVVKGWKQGWTSRYNYALIPYAATIPEAYRKDLAGMMAEYCHSDDVLLYLQYMTKANKKDMVEQLVHFGRGSTLLKALRREPTLVKFIDRWLFSDIIQSRQTKLAEAIIKLLKYDLRSVT